LWAMSKSATGPIKELGIARAWAFSPDGGRVATTDNDGTVAIWDSRTGRQLAKRRLYVADMRAVACSSDGSRVVSVSDRGAAEIWETRTGRHQSLRGVAGQVNCAAFSDDGLHVVTGSDNGTAQLWDAGTAGERHALLGHTRS